MRRTRRPMSLRSWFLCLAVLGGSASLVVAAISGWWSWQEQRDRIGASLMATSRAVTEAVDRELDQAAALARGLSTSTLLAREDFAGFERQARQAISFYGYYLILKSPNIDFQLINTQVPPGAEPPKLVSVSIDPALRQGRVHVAPLRQSRVSDVWFTAVEVPVLESDGQLRFVISMLVPSAAFQRIIDEQHLPPSWSPVILDSDWKVVARDVNRDKFLGQKGGAQEFQHAPDGLHEVRLLDGDRALSAHSHSRRFEWTAAVAMPTSAMLRQALNPILAAALSGFAVAALATGAVLVFAARIASSIGLLAAATRALATGERIDLPRFPVRELTLVGDGMQQAAAEIAANRYELEARIAEATRELRRESEERREAENALAQARRLDSLGQLTSGLAHDFNNLLTIISSNLELIESKSPNGQIARLARNAQRGAARGARLVEALLGFARKQPVRSEVVNPNLVIKEFVPILKGAAGDDVELQLLLSPTVFPCCVDPVQLQSAVLNLVTNARAAMPSGGRISIETANIEVASRSVELAPDLKDGGYVQITVADTGIGMSPEVAARAFEPFFTTKDIRAGTGLGLSQVYGFAKQSGGHASLSSEEGVGTTVRLYLPCSMQAEAGSAHKRVVTPVESAGGSVVIMIVDDDPDVRAVLVEGVEALGYRVTEAANGGEAIARIAAGEQVDLVLTDYLMPGLTGRELGQHITALGRDIPLVLISGNVAIEQEKGTLPVLHKPVRFADLSRVIAEVLGR